MTAAEYRAEIARLEAELVRAHAAHDDVSSALHSLGLIVRGSCAAMIAAVETLSPASAESTGGVARLFHDLAAKTATSSADDSPRAPVLRLPIRNDKPAAAADTATTGDATTHQNPREDR